jgi:vacuolar-type H+-ATPase subunit C/Vma6
MDIAEEESEDAGIRKRCLEMLRSRDIGEMENRLYNLYYNDPDEEIKKTAYDTIQAGKDKS